MTENIKLAFASLLASKMRALLTMLGIIIGVSSVITIMTLGASLGGTITGSMQDLGVNNVVVALQFRSASNRPRSFTLRPEDFITEEMINALTAEYPDDIRAVSFSQSVGSGRVSEGRKYANVSMTGVNADYFAANTVTMNAGRIFNSNDIEGYKKVAVVSDYLVNRIFGMADPLGQSITAIAGDHTDVYTIIGVYQYEQNALNFSMNAEEDTATGVYIPLSTANKITSSSGYTSVTLVTPAGSNSAAFSKTAADFLNRYYTRNDLLNITAYSMESMLDLFMNMLNTIQTAIVAIAAISLLVGGIGVMNIMLVSITERTREIGTRKAIGATGGAIRIQFIVEAVIICLIGGIIGIALGVSMGSLGANLLGVPAKASLSTMAVSAGFCMLIGVFFGYYPANKAAKMDPIEALRYE